MAKPGDWVGACIEQELREVIAWKHEIKNPPKVKRDPGSRFSDDGSNFRSIIVSLNLETQPNVQISKVLHAKDPVTILVTDGFTQVRARLSEAAVTTLETELGEKIDHTTKGDVFAIKEAAIISTPYGPSDEHVQLSITGIEYLYHLRKPLGQPKPAEEREEVQKLIEQITSLRHQQYAGLDEGNRSPPHSPAWSRRADVGRDNQTRRDGRKTTAPRSQQAVADLHSSPQTRTQQSPNTQLGVATQVPTRRKPAGPSLSEDGFELADGANLDRPLQAGFAAAKRRPSSSSQQQPAPPDVTGAKLLNLLKRETDAQQTSSHRPPPPPPRSPSPRRPSPAPARVQSTSKDASPKAPVQPEPQQVNSSPHAPRAQASPKKKSPGVIVAPEPVSASSAIHSTSRTHVSGEPPSRDYSRRKIPRDQQKLLDQPSSWLPSLPGRKFPHPNVPIELLTRWNAQVATCDQSDGQVQSPHVELGAQMETEPPIDKRLSAEGSDSSSLGSESPSEDEEFSASQWPPSPVQKRPVLPPDSTMASNMKSSPIQQRTALPPDSSNEESSRPSSSHQMPSSRRSQHRQNSPPARAVHPLPKKPDWVSPNRNPYNPHNPSPSQRVQKQYAKFSEQAQNSSPVHKGSSQQQLERASGSSINHSPLASQTNPAGHLSIRSSLSTPQSSPTTARQSEPPPHTTPASVVKATQLNIIEDDDGMEMEISVPRSLERDPALEHRKRRSEHFKNAQRREW